MNTIYENNDHAFKASNPKFILGIFIIKCEIKNIDLLLREK